MSLAMKTECQACGGTLAADGVAFICSYECTYCADCEAKLDACPNCQGELVRRPRRVDRSAGA